MRDFKKLEIWKDAHSLALTIYTVTKSFPSSEQFGLVQQLRRASSSVSANIAEGCGRGSEPDFLRFLYNSAGSIKEVETLLMLCRDLNYLDESTYLKLNGDIMSLARKLYSFMDSIKVKKEGLKPQASSLERV